VGAVSAMRKLRSAVTKLGLTRTPHRALMRAMGLDDAAIAKPMVGVVSMTGELNPIERLWLYLKDNQLSRRVFAGTAEIIEAWNGLLTQTGRIRTSVRVGGRIVRGAE
jgi:dihydroxyacid dehydratase/phosphogluconate dehydratase